MSTTTARILIVAYRTAATQALYNAVRDRAKRGPCAFTLLVPRPDFDPGEEAELTLELALPFLDRAARDHVEGIIGRSEPIEAVRDLWAKAPFDEIIVSTLPAHVSKWLHVDLPHRVAREFEVPVEVVTASHERHRDESVVHGGLPDRL